MRMWPYVHARAQQEFGGGRLGAKYERTDHLPLRGGKCPPDLEAADVPRARDDDRLYRIAGETVTGLRVFGGLPAHHGSSSFVKTLRILRVPAPAATPAPDSHRPGSEHARPPGRDGRRALGHAGARR